LTPAEIIEKYGVVLTTHQKEAIERHIEMYNSGEYEFMCWFQGIKWRNPTPSLYNKMFQGWKENRNLP
jgi:hypothetical protein